MNQDKLDGLYARATDERTPEEERHTAAVLYLKHTPKNRIATLEELRTSITKDVFHSLFGPEIAEFQHKMTEQKDRADAAVKQAEKAESDLRDLKDAIRAARNASEKVARLVDGEAQKQETGKVVSSPGIASQIDEMFVKNGPFRYYQGGFKW
jgi:hypothetical protein